MVNRTVAPVGTIKHLSVSVLVADKMADAEEDGAEPVLTPRTEQELRTIEKMVQSALGIDKTRGDQLNVVSMPFADEFYEQPALPEPTITDQLYVYLPLLKYVLAGLGALLMYMMLVRPALKTLKSEATVQHFKTVKELEEEMAAGRSATVQLDETEQMRQNILKAEHSPSQVIRTWMTDQE